jgi:uncharacterized protein (DUF305 family)
MIPHHQSAIDGQRDSSSKRSRYGNRESGRPGS